MKNKETKNQKNQGVNSTTLKDIEQPSNNIRLDDYRALRFLKKRDEL